MPDARRLALTRWSDSNWSSRNVARFAHRAERGCPSGSRSDCPHSGSDIICVTVGADGVFDRRVRYLQGVPIRIQMRVFEARRILQAESEHPIQADVNGPRSAKGATLCGVHN